MKTAGLVLAIAIAAGADAPRQEARSLVLVARTVEVQVHENLAIVRVTYKVRNAGGRQAEGSVEFRLPAGAAVCEATLLKQISKNERRSKVLTAETASKLYSRVVARSLDPALVECDKEGRCRLRFFPIQPGDDQTASVLFALEVVRDEVASVLKLSLQHGTNFRRTKTTRDRLELTLRSAASIGNVRSSSHELSGSGPYTSELREVDDQLVLRYELNSGARPYDFTRRVDWLTQKVRRDRSIRPEDAERAILARRDLEAGADAAARHRIREVAPVVWKDTSLLVIDRAVAEEFGVDLFPADAAKCDILRDLMGQPSLKRERPCEQVVETTLTPRSNGRFDVTKAERIRHVYGCPVKAGAMDDLRLVAAEFAR